MSILTALIVGIFIGNNVDRNEIHPSYTLNKNTETNRTVSLTKKDDLYINVCSGKTLSLKMDKEFNRVSNENPQVNDIYIHDDKQSITVQAKEKIYNNNKIQITSKSNDYFVYINTVKCEGKNPFIKHFDISLASH